MPIGERIKQGRLSKGLTQKQFAELIDSATGTIQQYELNLRIPRQNQIDKILKKTELPISFFQSTQPFEDLKFLEQLKAVILQSLENHGYFSWKDRTLNDIDNYEFWKCIADHIVSIVRTNENTLSIQYKETQKDETEQVRFVTRSLQLDFNEVIEPLIESGHAVTTYGILRHLNSMNAEGQQEAARSVAIIAGNPDYQKDKE